MKNFLLLMLITAVLSSCNNSDAPTAANVKSEKPVLSPVTEKAPVILEIKKIAGCSPAQVKAILGAPDNLKAEPVMDSPCDQKTCQQFTYRKGQIEIVFINNKADWITIHEVNHLGFSKEATECLGLPITQPDFASGTTIRWKYLAGINEISIFTDGAGGIDYFYILCSTPM